MSIIKLVVMQVINRLQGFKFTIRANKISTSAGNRQRTTLLARRTSLAQVLAAVADVAFTDGARGGAGIQFGDG